MAYPRKMVSYQQSDPPTPLIHMNPISRNPGSACVVYIIKEAGYFCHEYRVELINFYKQTQI